MKKKMEKEQKREKRKSSAQDKREFSITKKEKVLNQTKF